MAVKVQLDKAGITWQQCHDKEDNATELAKLEKKMVDKCELADLKGLVKTDAASKRAKDTWYCNGKSAGTGEAQLKHYAKNIVTILSWWKWKLA